MEIVTPEEIAHVVVAELMGSNTGRDIVQGLDATVMGPTYRGGALRQKALDQLRKLEKQHGVSSIAFEALGPPRLTKLLYEAHLLGCVYGSPAAMLADSPKQLSQKLEAYLRDRQDLRQTILSVGLAILLSDGEQYIRGAEVLIPLRAGKQSLPVTTENLNKWTHDGWIDLREANMAQWQSRVREIQSALDQLPSDESGSRYEFDRHYWEHFETLDEGKLAAYILHHEERGGRIKR